jgi:hypothetical protein
MYKVYQRLIEDFSPEQAHTFLKKTDPSLYSQLDISKLSSLRRKYALKYHSDKGHDPEKMKLINQAFDVLSKTSNKPSYSYAGASDNDSYDEDLYADDEKYNGIPIWAWAGYSGGLPPRAGNTPFDRLKREAWILAGKPTLRKDVKEYYYNFFDGFFSRDSISLFSSKKSIPNTVPLFLEWVDNFHRRGNVTQAVMVAPKSDRNAFTVYPIVGDSVLPSFTLRLEETSGHWSNDRRNVETLKKALKSV